MGGSIRWGSIRWVGLYGGSIRVGGLYGGGSIQGGLFGGDSIWYAVYRWGILFFFSFRVSWYKLSLCSGGP